MEVEGSEIKINGTVYVPKGSNGPREGERHVIVIADNRGLTLVGWMNPDAEGEYLRVCDARCIIRWGTSEHLAQLANNGPRSNTKLGAAGTVYVRRDGIVAFYETETSKWR